MASRTLLRSVCLAEPWRPPHRTAGRKSIAFSPSSSMRLCGGGDGGAGGSRLRCGCESVRFPSFHKQALRFNCSSNHNSSSAHTSSDGDGDGHEQGPPQEAVLKAISEVSKSEGRVGQTTNVIIGGTVADDSTNEWLALDQKVNSYPTVRGFTAIGTGGDDFVQSMIVAVESVLQQPIPEGRIKQKVSSRGKYVSVNIGPVRVISSEQVQAIYNAMRRDDRMKYFL